MKTFNFYKRRLSFISKSEFCYILFEKAFHSLDNKNIARTLQQDKKEDKNLSEMKQCQILRLCLSRKTHMEKNVERHLGIHQTLYSKGK